MAGRSDVLANRGERFAHAVGQRAVGLIALVVVAGALTGANAVTGRSTHASAAAASAPGTPAKAAPHAPAARTPAASAKAVTAKAVSGRPGAKSPATRAASTDGNSAPVVTAVPQNNVPAGPNGVHMDEHLTYQYDALGRRDPFQSLVDGQFVGVDVGGDAPPDPGGIKVVGIVWGATDQFALVEDVRGNSFVLRKGDKVQNGVVEGLKRDGVIVNITADGQSQTVVIPLTVRKGDQNAR
jgi:hypothetical protein